MPAHQESSCIPPLAAARTSGEVPAALGSAGLQDLSALQGAGSQSAGGMSQVELVTAVVRRLAEQNRPSDLTVVEQVLGLNADGFSSMAIADRTDLPPREITGILSTANFCSREPRPGRMEGRVIGSRPGAETH